MMPTTPTSSGTQLRPEPQTLAGRVTIGTVIAAEWIKLRSLRSTWWSLAAAVVALLGMGLLAASNGSSRHASAVSQAADSQFGVIFATLAVTMLGALSLTAEYSTGMIRSSLAAVPRRTSVLLAKAVVLFVTVFAVCGLTAVASLLLTAQVFESAGHRGARLGDPGVLPVVLGAPLYLAVAAVAALAVGAIVRSTAGALGLLVGIFFIAPVVASIMTMLHGLAPYLPSNAGGALSRQTLTQHPLGGGSGFALFCAYVVVVVTGAAFLLRRRDA